MPHYEFTGFGLCFAEVTGLQVCYYLDNSFARSLRALRRTGGNEFDKRSKRSVIIVPTGVQWTPAGWAENGN